MTASADGPEIVDVLKEGVSHVVIPFTRRITPLRDLMCLWIAVRLIQKFKPDIVHTHTPKAGLIGMLAAWLCGVKVRMHTVAGLPIMESRGVRRWLLSITEQITIFCATGIYPNGEGMRTFLVGHLGVSLQKVKVLGHGSSNGIDSEYFFRHVKIMDQARLLRTSHGISLEDIAFCFVGRVVHDKGITELVHAFVSLQEKQSSWLFLVGPLEQELDPLRSDVMDIIRRHPRIIMPGFQADVRPWMLAADIFLFPSYREGFPNVVLQACALELPCVVTDIPGCNEIIQHEKNGLVVAPKDTAGLLEAMIRLLEAPLERLRFGQSARVFIKNNFEQQVIWNELLKEYLERIAHVRQFH